MEDARILGDYQIIKKIGHGALGTVFLAEHRFMKRQYMLKVLPEELASDRGFLQRFEELVGGLAGLEHPNIVKIHNVSSSHGFHFLVSDCVVDDLGETTNLAQYLAGRQGRIAEEQVFSLIKQVADALDYAHGKQSHGKALAHRGLKLNNILIAKTGTDIQVRLCDFGLSTIIGEGAVLSRTYRVVADSLGVADQLIPAHSTDDGAYPSHPIESGKVSILQQSFLQTYHFMAPEQREIQRVKEVGAAADCYACGVLAYYLLTGEFPAGSCPMPEPFQSGRDWTRFLRACLHPKPAERPKQLKEYLPAVGQAVAAAEPAPLSLADLSPAPYPVPRAVVEAAATSQEPAAEPQTAPQPEVVPEPAMAAAAAAPAPAAAALKPALNTPSLERPTLDPDPAASLLVDPTVKHYQPEKKEVKDIEPIPSEMAVIEGGVFKRGRRDGNRDEMPPHEIELSGFAIDVHCVTNEQFARFLEVMGGEKDHQNLDLIRLKDSRLRRVGGKLSIESGYSKHPVVGVTWYGAVAYAKWVGKRLPTEAEWEVAANPEGEAWLYPTGDELEKSQANFFSADTTAVKSYPPNPRGLFDMAGNVYEWCQDWYGYSYYEESALEPYNPKGPLQGVYRVLRGGCWKSLKEDLRCSRRHRNNPGTANSTYGFRCASDTQQV